MFGDRYQWKPDHPRANAHEQLQVVLDAMARTTDPARGWQSPAGNAIRAAKGERAGTLLRACLDRLEFIENLYVELTDGTRTKPQSPAQWDTYLRPRRALKTALDQLVHQQPLLDAEDLVLLLKWCNGRWLDGLQPDKALSFLDTNGEAAVRLVAAFADQQGLTEDMRSELADLEGLARDEQELAERLLAGDEGAVELNRGDAFADVALDDFEAMDGEPRRIWQALVNHCNTAEGSKPTAKWTKAAKPLLEPLSAADFSGRLARWLDALAKPRSTPHARGPAAETRWLLDDRNAETLKGLLWCVGIHGDDGLVPALATAGRAAYKKVPGHGARATAIGNACVLALANMSTRASLGGLAILKVRVNFGSAQKAIDKALDKVAAKLELPREDIDELAVPAYGLTDVGRGEDDIGEYKALLVVDDRNKIVLTWQKEDGSAQKSVPKAITSDFKADLKELKRSVTEIEAMLSAQRIRLDTLYLEDRAWSVAQWRERYVDHPLVGTLARRLLWTVTSRDSLAVGGWLNGTLVDLDDVAVPELEADDARLRLWHPIAASAEAVTQWREWLARHRIRQPFKQAHREVYRITDAERETREYSNRFAAHLMPQPKYHALCQSRRWSDSLRMMLDSGDDGRAASWRPIPNAGLTAEFWVEGAGEDFEDTTDNRFFRYLKTDHVRFRRPNVDAESVPLVDVDPIVFSEIMRDVDLFTSVCSVGADPTWVDNAEDDGRRYWESFAWGELSGMAATRREVLERLVPALKIADRCSIDGSYLCVRGDLRTYKIHIGSGNIRMEPNDEHLCIVAEGDDDMAGLFLPFEGDRRLAEILSKALLLAADTKIEDPVIVNQIK